MKQQQKKYIILGGGAAGIFGAIRLAELCPEAEVVVLEKTQQLLSKVRISGGGRCNVTHACFEPRELAKRYPRGSKELLGPFTRFGPKDTIAWFDARGVTLKVEEDGRMFPTTDSSQTIIDCLLAAADKVGVKIQRGISIVHIQKRSDGSFSLTAQSGEFSCDALLIATGSNPATFALLNELGLTTTPLVPSLFTFNVPTSPLLDIAGVAVARAKVAIEGTKLIETGPLLLTHWGFSGPAILRLSAWGARELHAMDYQATIRIGWAPDMTLQQMRDALFSIKERDAKKTISSETLYGLPKNLWLKLLERSNISPTARWLTISHASLNKLAETLTADRYALSGKTTYKTEFVTCGGIDRQTIDWRRMESRQIPGLFFAGEVIDVDGITGGFNFQNAWTTAWLAAEAMA